MTQIKFGTDGWRAIIAENFTFENVLRLSQATADYWRCTYNEKPLRVVIGYDRRFLSDRFAQAASEVFAGNGYEVILANEPTPTPAVSLAVKGLNCKGGIMFTASHNPPFFNGFKIKSHYGGPSFEQESQGIEKMLDSDKIKTVSFQDGFKNNLIKIKNLKIPHLDAVKKCVDFNEISTAKLKVAHDALFGVGAGCFSEILKNSDCIVTNLNYNHDPLFGGIRPEPLPENYKKTCAWLKKNRHDICLVTDGDADRIGAIDEKGNPLTAHQVICLILYHLVENRGQNGKIIKSINTTSMLDKMCSDYGLEFFETKIGFRFICEKMLSLKDVLMGCEESGSIGFSNHIPERDGILAGMILIEFLTVKREHVSSLIKKITRKYGPHFYKRLDLTVDVEKGKSAVDKLINLPPTKICGNRIIEINAIDGVKFIFKNGWLMFRSSGTEPLLRIYAESESENDVQKLINYGYNQVKYLVNL